MRQGLATGRSHRRLVACAIVLSLGLISILMPARMLAGELHSIKKPDAHEMPCHPPQPCGGCEHGDQNTGCGADGMCIATCSPLMMRLPHEVLLRLRIVATILLPADETNGVSLFPDPPKRPPRIT